MNSKSHLLCAAVVFLAASLQAAEPRVISTRVGAWRFVPSYGITPEAIDHFGSTAEKMLAAIQSADLRAFVLRGDDRFQKLTEQQFRVLTETWGSKLRSGVEMVYLGDLNRSAAYTTMWRIRFGDGSEDAVLTISAGKRGSVAAFALN